ncbi:MAG TPA: DUF6151 family protein [Myxococcota bacterium]
MDVALRCRCGVVTGTLVDVSPSAGNRAVCYCDDCQAFAKAIGRVDVLDAHGGSDIVQLRPAQLKLSITDDNLKCLRLSDTGMWRFHTGCCNTPVGNAMNNPKMPFVGVVISGLVDLDEQQKTDVFGARIAVQGRFARNVDSADTIPTAPPPAMFLRVARLIVGGFIKRAHKPSPLTNSSGQFRVVPRVLSSAERAALS